MYRPAALKTLSHFYANNITTFEVRLMERFCPLRNVHWLTLLFKTSSRLGDGPLWLATGIILLLLNEEHARLVALSAFLSVGLSVVLFMCVKNLIGRPRPFETFTALTCMMAPPDKFSFPSGHTMTAFAVWGSFSAGLPVLGHFYLAAAIMIGLSRVFLGLHYPTDVLVGALLGATIGLNVACYII